jgi:hypothetical protein
VSATSGPAIERWKMNKGGSFADGNIPPQLRIARPRCIIGERGECIESAIGNGSS